MLIQVSIINPDRAHGGRDLCVGLRPRFQMQDSLIRMKPSSCCGVTIKELDLNIETRTGTAVLQVPEQLQPEAIEIGKGYVLLDGTKIIALGNVLNIEES